MNEKMFSVAGNIVDIERKEIFKGEIFVNQGQIIEIRKIENVPEQFIIPGFIDSHVHIESSMLSPSRFAEIAVKHGTIGVVADPHEITNVLGKKGIEWMIENSKQVPFYFYFGVPSCVPATDFETSGATLNSADVKELLSRNDTFFLAEMMNYPGVIFNNEEVLAKIQAAKEANKVIDGHAPFVSGEDLKKYVAAGISTDHECTNLEEALEKISLGMKILIREGSAAKNFDNLFSLIEMFPDKIMFCTDDCHPDDLVKKHINNFVIRAVEKGANLFNVLKIVSKNPIEHYKLNVGWVQEKQFADFIVVDNLLNFNVLETYVKGEKVYANKKVLFPEIFTSKLNYFERTFLSQENISVKDEGRNIKVIEVIENELITRKLILTSKVENGFLVSDVERDILKIVVANRYDNFSKVSVGFVRNFNLKNGAIASSIAHDSHNLIALGTSDSLILKAINKVIEHKGGIVACDEDEIIILPLNIAGLMTDSDGYSTASLYENLNKKVQNFGSTLKAPFMTLSFIALLVIPELKIGDKGLFDVTNFQLTSLFE